MDQYQSVNQKVNSIDDLMKMMSISRQPGSQASAANLSAALPACPAVRPLSLVLREGPPADAWERAEGPRKRTCEVTLDCSANAGSYHPRVPSVAYSAGHIRMPGSLCMSDKVPRQHVVLLFCDRPTPPLPPKPMSRRGSPRPPARALGVRREPRPARVSVFSRRAGTRA